MVQETLGYEILVSNGSFRSLEEHLVPFLNHRKIHVVTDENVHNLYGTDVEQQLSGWNLSWSILSPGEENKTIEATLSVISDMVHYGIQRSDLMIAFGGGVVGDLAGFAASMYLRGIDFIQIPTTLLSQVDSSVGSKVGVDYAGGKNLIGSFYKPKFVLIDPNILVSLSERQFQSGMAEVIKYGCIHDADLFEICETYGSREKIQPHLDKIIARCCSIKEEYVLIDYYDRKERLYLNFGHTIGHALESLTQYKEFTHGEAVSIGMNVISRVFQRQGIINQTFLERLEKVCESFLLPVSYNGNIEECFPFLEKDKKNLNRKLNIVLCPRLGICEIHQVPIEVLKELIHDYTIA